MAKPTYAIYKNKNMSDEECNKLVKKFSSCGFLVVVIIEPKNGRDVREALLEIASRY